MHIIQLSECLLETFLIFSEDVHIILEQTLTIFPQRKPPFGNSNPRPPLAQRNSLINQCLLSPLDINETSRHSLFDKLSHTGARLEPLPRSTKPKRDFSGNYWNRTAVRWKKMDSKPPNFLQPDPLVLRFPCSPTRKNNFLGVEKLRSIHPP